MAVARTPAELAVLEELAASRDDGSVTVLSATETRRRLDGCGADDLVGGAFLAADLRVDPRVTVAALASWVQDQPGGEVRWRTAVTAVEPGVVQTTRRPVRASGRSWSAWATTSTSCCRRWPRSTRSPGAASRWPAGSGRAGSPPSARRC
ncbi:FAD-dependent oxidoreductase [Desertihabitans brevis]|uniref:FAD-dependent oxidoreductase n=1 Tax=Desertihabitans brevis TaxID=2268447 RepID=UPI002D78A84B|nr:FAD-dependent oxidoreductase [Desertihabitans brevis]